MNDYFLFDPPSLYRNAQKTSRKSVRPNQLTILTQKTHSKNNFRMTLKLSWESLKCQILLSLIHSNPGCTFYCAANLEIHDKSLFQSFLPIIFAQPGWKDPHDWIFMIFGCAGPLSASGLHESYVADVKIVRQHTNTTTVKRKTRNI